MVAISFKLVWNKDNFLRDNPLEGCNGFQGEPCFKIYIIFGLNMIQNLINSARLLSLA